MSLNERPIQSQTAYCTFTRTAITTGKQFFLTYGEDAGQWVKVLVPWTSLDYTTKKCASLYLWYPSMQTSFHSAYQHNQTELHSNWEWRNQAGRVLFKVAEEEKTAVNVLINWKTSCFLPSFDFALFVHRTFNHLYGLAMWRGYSLWNRTPDGDLP